MVVGKEAGSTSEYGMGFGLTPVFHVRHDTTDRAFPADVITSVAFGDGEFVGDAVSFTGSRSHLLPPGVYWVARIYCAAPLTPAGG